MTMSPTRSKFQGPAHADDYPSNRWRSSSQRARTGDDLDHRVASTTRRPTGSNTLSAARPTEGFPSRIGTKYR
ncbi:MAG: hypothetical protein AVDCRST_MAG73-4267 [uncultured Thermomicrobiales bacterium]|uniref:Uncharacterized protein n=1 Tax=uncultured Thermomicrobiales bacterium TaxID=1645740 RepID=A0A6J4V484_9BACT|nr:MAG: hypothetical protein AVDCRST_MAG73-4267 [uncultured Thermomicrobiales bacterium]